MQIPEAPERPVGDGTVVRGDGGPDAPSGAVERRWSIGRPGWRHVLGAWITSQVIAGAAILTAASWPFGGALHWTGFTTRWDGSYYLTIAELGYGSWPTADPFPRWAFSPGLPAAISGIDRIGLDPRIGIHVLNQLALLAALVAVFLLARRRGSTTAAALAVWSLALFPAAFSFSMTYPSALFVAAVAWAFLLAEDGHDVSAGVLVAAATLLRPNGLVVAVALVVAVGSVRRALVVCAPGVLALGAWCAYCADRTGDALVWVTVKERWVEIDLLDVFTGGAKWSLVPHVTLGLIGLGVVVLQRRRLPASWVVLTVLIVGLPFVTGMVGMARYTGECFPVFVAGGQVLERLATRVRVAVLLAGAGGLFAFAFVVGRYGLVP